MARTPTFRTSRIGALESGLKGLLCRGNGTIGLERTQGIEGAACAIDDSPQQPVTHRHMLGAVFGTTMLARDGLLAGTEEASY